MNRNLYRTAAIVLIAAAAIGGLLQLSAETAEAWGCGSTFDSCTAWCTGEGKVIYGSYGSCRSSCVGMYCDYGNAV